MNAEKFTYRQIEEQHAGGHQASVLVERSNGEISVGTYTGESKEVPGHYEVLVDGGRGARDVLPGSLTDEHQAMLAEQLAGTLVVRRIGSNAIKGMELGGQDGPSDDGIKREELRALREQVAASDRSVEAAPSPGVQEQIDKLTTGLSDPEIDSLQRYARYMDSKAEAQKNGDGGGSTTYGQYAGQELRAMSPAAQAVSSQFLSLWKRL